MLMQATATLSATAGLRRAAFQGYVRDNEAPVSTESIARTHVRMRVSICTCTGGSPVSLPSTPPLKFEGGECPAEGGEFPETSSSKALRASSIDVLADLERELEGIDRVSGGNFGDFTHWLHCLTCPLLDLR